MKIEDLLEAAEIPRIKQMLVKSREDLKKSSFEILELEKQKKELIKNLKNLETKLKNGIANEVSPGTKEKRYKNESFREAEFIVRSVEDSQIVELREQIEIVAENIFHRKILIDCELKHYDELLLDYQLAISIIPHLLPGSKL